MESKFGATGRLVASSLSQYDNLSRSASHVRVVSRLDARSWTWLMSPRRPLRQTRAGRGGGRPDLSIAVAPPFRLCGRFSHPPRGPGSDGVRRGGPPGRRPTQILLKRQVRDVRKQILQMSVRSTPSCFCVFWPTLASLRQPPQQTRAVRYRGGRKTTGLETDTGFLPLAAWRHV